MTSFVQRLRSLRHGFWYGVSERIRWSRGTHQETPALELPALAPEEAQRIAALQRRYQIRFELELNAATSRRNYEYLDILDSAWTRVGRVPPAGGALCDVGCANFWYAPALQAFFRPASLLGVEVEGHRLYRDGHTRRDYAAGYLARYPHGRFLVADYAHLAAPADLITAWFPFLSPASILAWRLPLRLLQPEALFGQIRQNLRPGGLFVMINHGPAEARLASLLCGRAGLVCQLEACAADAPLSAYRLEAPLLSLWAGGA